MAELEDPNLRPRNMMSYKPLVSQDFYYAYGVVPPRKFNPSRPPAQPQWNAWGSCVDTSCTYVPLKQRYDGYSKYSQRIERGFRGFRALKDTLKRGDWEAAAAQVELSPPAGTQPSPTVDMLLKAALLASQLLVSPNNLKEIQEAALARFYVNEAAYALELISRAVAKQDREAALFAYDFGRDSGIRTSPWSTARYRKRWATSLSLYRANNLTRRAAPPRAPRPSRRRRPGGSRRSSN